MSSISNTFEQMVKFVCKGDSLMLRIQTVRKGGCDKVYEITILEILYLESLDRYTIYDIIRTIIISTDTVSDIKHAFIINLTINLSIFGYFS